MSNFKNISEEQVSANAWVAENMTAAAEGVSAFSKSVIPVAESASISHAHRRIDPRASLGILVLLNLIAFAPTSQWAEACAVALCAAVMWWCGRPSAMVRWLVAYGVLFAASHLIVCFPNEVTASFAAMIIMFRRVFCVGMFATNMIATTRVGEMASALQRIHAPRGMVTAISVALRFFPTMGKEFVSVIEAMKVRGFSLTPASVLRHPATTIENLMVPAMSRLAIVAEELSNAAIVRGIDSGAVRTSYYDLRLSGVDIVFFALFAAIVVCVALVKVGIVA